MAQVLDYSKGFPGGHEIARPRDVDGKQKFVGAMRYIGRPGHPKCATRAELVDFSWTGLGMGLVFEEAAGNWRGGRAAGAYDAQRARAHATAIGFPTGRPIYMAIDEDVVTVGEFASMLEYLRGAHGPLGGPRLTGVYGEADVVDRARSAGVATWIWQTKAWSHGRVTPAHLRQLIGTVTIGGIGCDVNDVLAADWGQHNYVGTEIHRGGTTMLIQGSAAKFNTQAMTDGGLKTNLDAATAGADASMFPRLPVSDGVWDALEARTTAMDAVPAKLDAIAAQLAAIQGALSDDEAHIIAAIREIQNPDVELTPEQLQALLDAMPAAAREGLRQLLAVAGQQEGPSS